MATAIRDCGFVKLRMKDYRPRGVLSSRGSAHHTDASDVVPRIFGSHRLMPQDAICEPGVLEVFPANIVKSLRTIGGAHAVHLDNHKPKVGQRRGPPHAAKALRRV